MTEHSHLRASDADRDRIAEVIRLAAAEGRLEPAELEERLEAAYAAKTLGELRTLIDDLPVSPVGPVPPVAGPRAPGGPPVPVMHYDRSIGALGSQRREGVWEIGPTHQATATLGDVVLDLREARFTSRETVIHCFALLGSVKITVNPSTEVVTDGTRIGGDFTWKDRAEPRVEPDSPLVRVVGYAVLGDVSVRRKELPGPKKGWFRRR